MRLLFANIGWMSHYRGNSKTDQIVGGGSYRNDDKHEAFNFMPINGKCYGYVQAVGFAGINLLRIDNSCTDDSISNVLVIWIATHPKAGGTYIVGWYKNATVYKGYQPSSNPLRNNYDYNIVAKAEDCVLVPIDRRTFQVPRAKTGGKGFLGQSNVWYADSLDKSVQSFRSEVVAYIKKYTGDVKAVSKHTLKVDAEARSKVEKAAVDFVTNEYKSLGFKITSREKENLGWDLDTVKKGVKLKLEVKGLAQSQLSVHISANEYNTMMANKNDYRLCVVTNAIKKPTLVNFIWSSKENAWVSDADPDIKLTFDIRPTYLAYVE